jgi:hypothetical protein
VGFRLRVEEMASGYGGYPTRGGPPAWRLGVGLQLLTLENKLVTKCHKGPRTLTDSLDKRPKLRKMDWIDLAQDRGQWRAPMNTIMKLLDP